MTQSKDRIQYAIQYARPMANQANMPETVFDCQLDGISFFDVQCGVNVFNVLDCKDTFKDGKRYTHFWYSNKPRFNYPGTPLVSVFPDGWWK